MEQLAQDLIKGIAQIVMSDIMQVLTATTEAAASVEKMEKEAIAAMPETVSAEDVKKLIQQIDQAHSEVIKTVRDAGMKAVLAKYGIEA